ncbi:MAG: hypothetical protein ACOY90_07685 [Candidatus Zhuqueibacterota bacterium]
MKKLWLYFFVASLAFRISLSAQVLSFPEDSLNFAGQKIDSVFIFADSLAITARGENLHHIRFEGGAIRGENIPPSLKLRQPKGAIIYRSEDSFQDLPAIIGRTNKTIRSDRFFRDYLLRMTQFKGASSKGEVSIGVWEPEAGVAARIFLKDGTVLECGEMPASKFRTKNNAEIDIADWQRIEPEIAGVWVNPPAMGNHRLTDRFLSSLAEGRLLIEFWDGLGWQLLEKALVNGVLGDEEITVEMSHSLFPPETAANFPAMFNGGSTGENLTNLFQALHSMKIGFDVFEGEKLTMTIPGNVKLHSGHSPQKKDEAIFRSAYAACKNNPSPLVFVHYHGLDDLNHSLGPDDPAALAHFESLWDWHNRLRHMWSGGMLIVSDHGAHSLPEDFSGANKFERKGTKGTHGDFIFADMAVPILADCGLDKSRPGSSLPDTTIEALWNFVGQSLVAEVAGKPIASGQLELLFAGKTFVLEKEHDSSYLADEFHFAYLKKGKPVAGQFRGKKLIEVVKRFGIAESAQVKAFSFDDVQLVYSNEDLKEHLALGVDWDAAQREGTFTLYPLKDQFPNRVLKQLRRIEFFIE